MAFNPIEILNNLRRRSTNDIGKRLGANSSPSLLPVEPRKKTENSSSRVNESIYDEYNNHSPKRSTELNAKIKIPHMQYFVAENPPLTDESTTRNTAVNISTNSNSVANSYNQQYISNGRFQSDRSSTFDQSALLLKMQQLEEKLKNTEDRLADAYDKIGVLKNEKDDMETRMKHMEELVEHDGLLSNHKVFERNQKGEQQQYITPTLSYSDCKENVSPNEDIGTLGTEYNHSDSRKSLSLEKIMAKKEKNFMPGLSKNSQRKGTVRKKGQLRLEPFSYANKNYPSLPHAAILIKLPDLTNFLDG